MQVICKHLNFKRLTEEDNQGKNGGKSRGNDKNVYYASGKLYNYDALIDL